nr:acyltransferase [Skermania sp. ID1734]
MVSTAPHAAPPPSGHSAGSAPAPSGHSAGSAPATPTSRGFVPALEGMRGFAALGVLLTHVAFQTGATATPVIGRVWERFDMAVAVFFALSGFLLWRGHALAARRLSAPPSLSRYWINRAARILPAYWVVVCIVLALLPGAGSGWRVWAANLSLVQVFVPLTLTNGLTQMWSLSVEVAFYIALPVLAVALLYLRDGRARWRIPALMGLAAASLGWAFIPIPTPDAIHSDNWLPGYLPWFIAGMLLAELAATDARRISRIAGNRRYMAATAVVAFLLSATDLAGPAGLTHPEPWQFSVKILLGAILGFALLAPLILNDTETRRTHRILESPLCLAIGRWSYGIFIWHLAVLAAVFPVFGIIPFNGSFVFVLVATVALSIPVASASYALVEEPVRRAVKRWESNRRIGGPNLGSTDAPGSAATPTATTAINAGS